MIIKQLTIKWFVDKKAEFEAKTFRYELNSHAFPPIWVKMKKRL